MEINAGNYLCQKDKGLKQARAGVLIDRVRAEQIKKLGIASAPYAEIARQVCPDCPVVGCALGALRAGIKADSLGSFPVDDE